MTAHASQISPPQDHALQGPVDALLQYHQPMSALQLHQDGPQAPFSAVPIQSYSIAAPSAPHTGISDSAVQYAAAVRTHEQGLLANGVQLQPLPTTPPHTGPSTPAGSHLHFNRVMQHPLHAQAAQKSGQVQQPNVTVGHPNTGEVAPDSVQVYEHMQADSGKMAAVNALMSVPAKMGFGGILSGVVKEAAETATKRPPVFRYEDFKIVSCPPPAQVPV